jgi:hypothetical protein
MVTSLGDGRERSGKGVDVREHDERVEKRGGGRCIIE